MSEWQPIETLPEDTDVLLFGDDVIMVGYWHWSGRKNRRKKHFVIPYDRVVPTHWMPLPDPPDLTAELEADVRAAYAKLRELDDGAKQ